MASITKKKIDYAKPWRAWVRQLKKHLTHETPVLVENNEGHLVAAKIQEINFKQWQVMVRFDSDNITKPGWDKVENIGLGGGYDPEDRYRDVWNEKQPVKEMWVSYSCLKFPKTKKNEKSIN